ncbi:helix-turn-helix transcriptional regulator [Streptomyces sp. C11-1]|uniref:Helix-turn-helix transcriptional regulator n=1 Tax=Streptomyces durocortorensis TaxID=2811104 RepID=A0ABY9VZ29_9ACTN|nr:helix-turn-helix transcriptional regulator [Streptomyces durocortorensis]WNF29156.1 helix-turn-helix transcriptional regulator [Streptomyces durocortorensis]
MLELLGLDTHTEAVYRAMLEHPQDGVTALARHLDLSEDAVRAAWDRLAELSLLQPSTGSAQPPRAVSPELGLDYLLARRQAEFAVQRQRITAARTAASQLISEYADRRPAGGPVSVEHLDDVTQIRTRLALLTEGVRREVMAFAPGGAQTKENRASARPLNEKLLGRGVTLRTIYLESFRNCAASMAHANWLTAMGGQVRTVGELPLRMTILDRSTAVIPLDSGDSSKGAMVVTGTGTGTGMLTALCTLFETVWEASRPLGEEPRRQESELDRQEAAALRLLAEGHTDEGIAKRLGVSHRTARRIATGLMDRLGARSRFEAGVRATQRGWLPQEH